jgi:hypothetical protein
MSSLLEWSQLTTRAVFDYSVYTVARAYSPDEERLMGYVVFSAPVPYAVLAFRTLEEVARHLSGNRLGPDAVLGAIYTEEEWEREVL